MITHTSLKIEVNGKALPDCLTFSLSQPMHGHHFFRAEFPGKILEQDPLSLAADSLKLAGTEIKLELSNVKGESSFFKGVLTSIHSVGSNQAGYTQNVVLEGHSPTILLENGPSSQAFTKMSLKDMISKVTQGAPANLLSVNLRPRHSSPLAYTVQYNESAFAFADRLCRRYGQWCYYDGMELVVGEKQQPELELIYGTNLLHFDFAMKTASIHHSFTGYGYKGVEHLQGLSRKSDTSIGGVASFAMGTAEKSWQMPQPIFLHQFDEESALKSQLDEVARLSTRAAAAQKVTFRGSSTHPGLFPGAIIAVKGADRELGKYIISRIEHQYTHGGHYQNQFEAVPHDVEVSPLTQPQLIPQCGHQPGTVTDNNDPEGLGRVQVQLFWQKDTTTPWIRIAMPYGGADKGMYFIPEIGEEVLVGFEHGNAEKPYVAGTLYHGKARPESFKNARNDIKAIRTRSGHTIELIDTEGKEMVTISDKGGCIIQFDTKEKSLYISAPENLELVAKNIKISAEENIALAAKNEINAIAEGILALVSKKDTTIKADGAAIIEALKDLVLAGQNATLEGKTKTIVTSGAETTVSGKVTNIQGSATKTKIV